MKKILIFFVLMFIFIACGENRSSKNNTSMTPEDILINNIYLNGDGVISDIESADFPSRVIDEKEGYEKNGYSVGYKINGVRAKQDVFFL